MNRIFRNATSTMLLAVLVGLLFVQAPSAFALSFLRGFPSTVGPDQISSSTDTDVATEYLTAPGVITPANTLEHRVQYDIITSTTAAPLFSWTVHYDPSLALAGDIIGASTPTGFVDPAGNPHTLGGQAVETLFNKGFGLYNYNTNNGGAPWVIDYAQDHVTFIALFSGAIPTGGGVGDLAPIPNLPSFDLTFSPNVPFGAVSGDVLHFDDEFGKGPVAGPVVVPEPSSLSLVLIGAAIVACRRFCKA